MTYILLRRTDGESKTGNLKKKLKSGNKMGKHGIQLSCFFCYTVEKTLEVQYYG